MLLKIFKKAALSQELNVCGCIEVHKEGNCSNILAGKWYNRVNSILSLQRKGKLYTKYVNTSIIVVDTLLYTSSIDRQIYFMESHCREDRNILSFHSLINLFVWICSGKNVCQFMYICIVVSYTFKVLCTYIYTYGCTYVSISMLGYTIMCLTKHCVYQQYM